ncbi:DUF4097 family beta strand repeat-containing protein [Nocardiopsis suaedae]|uniref:DUF4097 family beta strand repeat-containing protein n=1 Tax=Nocardiopsis suaedae TaxID=3018444 RepID=A0ABT4TJ83_9ACTN|nr:DUF4097 family beta strand repeat-containing protein [Nocardiopsis suaedae]MDA2804748.1 DUF4097 family beta strand repeat-containing protein [Nocardiopsis suaedae]
MQTFTTPAPVTAVIDIPAGRIQVVAADRADTTVDIRPADASKGRDAKAAEQTGVAFGDGVLRVTGPGAANRHVGPTGAVEVTIQVPTGSDVDATSSYAEFRGVGRLGRVAGQGLGGAVRIDEAAGAHLTAFGDVSVGRLTGPAEVTTQKGDVTVDEAASGAVVLSTQMGDVTVAAAPGVSASLDAGTAHGRVHNSLKNTDGAPGLAIRATTSHGDITARTL